MTKLPEQRSSSPKNAKAIAPHKLMRTWRYKETKHSLKKKAKSVTLNFPLSLCSFTAKDNPTSSPSSSPVHSPTHVNLSPPSSPSGSPTPSPVTPRIPSPRQMQPMPLPPVSSITLAPIPVTFATHEFYWDHRQGLRAIAVPRRPRMDDPLAYFKSLSASDKIRLPIPACSSTHVAPMVCCG